MLMMSREEVVRRLLADELPTDERVAVELNALADQISREADQSLIEYRAIRYE